jgi:hypothetical protein
MTTEDDWSPLFGLAAAQMLYDDQHSIGVHVPTFANLCKQSSGNRTLCCGLSLTTGRTGPRVWGSRMSVMAADTPDDGEPKAAQASSLLGANNPFRGSLTPAEIAAETGRCLQVQHPAALAEPLPEELASLIRRLWEREDGHTE